MRYSITYIWKRLQDGRPVKVSWDEVKRGAYSAETWVLWDSYKRQKMTREEAVTFQEMERMDLTKNIEPDRIFYIDRD